MAKRKPRVHDEQGIKDGSREDEGRQDKRPPPVGPATSSLDRAMSEGTIEPDPDTPPQTPREELDR